MAAARVFLDALFMQPFGRAHTTFNNPRMKMAIAF